VVAAAQEEEASGPTASERLHVLTACVAIPVDNYVSMSLHNWNARVMCVASDQERTRPRDFADQLQAVKRSR
jgi:hypothetical protein